MDTRQFLATAINDAPIPDKCEMEKLVSSAREGNPKAMNKIILSHTRFVIRKAADFECFDLFDDLVQEGIIGLMIAVDRWDAAKGKFLTYAAYWVYKRMISFIQQSKIIHMPQSCKGNTIQIIHLDDERNAEWSGMKWNEVIRSDTMPPDIICMLESDKLKIVEFLDWLPGKEKEAITMIWNLGGDDVSSGRKIAKKLNLSSGVVSMRARNGIERIRNLLQGINKETETERKKREYQDEYQRERRKTEGYKEYRRQYRKQNREKIAQKQREYRARIAAK